MSAPRRLPRLPTEHALSKRLDGHARRLDTTAAANRRAVAGVAHDLLLAAPWLPSAARRAWRVRIARAARSLGARAQQLRDVEAWLLSYEGEPDGRRDPAVAAGGAP